MNGMLPDHDVNRVLIERQHDEARLAAHSDALGRLSRGIREQLEDHPVRSRSLAVLSPMAVVLAALAILG